MKTMASASAPSASSARAAAWTSAGSTAVRTLPSARVRSATSSRMSRSTTGTKSPHRPQVCRRSRRRISSTSRKPAVVISPARAPRRSSSALVPTVVPCTMDPSAATGPNCRSPCRNPTASSPRLDGTLAVRTRPVAASNSTRSVKVPPTSTPTIPVPTLPVPRNPGSRRAGHGRSPAAPARDRVTPTRDGAAPRIPASRRPPQPPALTPRRTRSTSGPCSGPGPSPSSSTPPCPSAPGTSRRPAPPRPCRSPCRRG